MSVTGAIGAGASLLGGIFGGNAAGQASQQEIQAINKGISTLQSSENTALGNFNPFLTGGQQAEGTLSQMLAQPGKGLLTPWTQQFTAPTAAQAAQTPGYQFQLQQGENALQNSAAAQGGLLSGGTLAGLNNYAQGVASTNYQNTFNNALTQYQSAYQTFLNNQQNQYNMLAGQAGQGLQAANAAGNVTTGIGGDIAQLYGAQGSAAAAGTIGQANAINGAIGGVANGLSSVFSPLSQMNSFAVGSPDASLGAAPGAMSGSIYGSPAFADPFGVQSLPS